MAYSDWRLQLLARIELALTWVHTLGFYEEEFSGKDFPQPEEKAVSLLLSIAWLRNPQTFSMLYRAQNQARRAYNSALKTLEKLRGGKAGYLPPVQPEPKAAVSATGKQTGRAYAAAVSANQTKPPGETDPPPHASKHDPAIKTGMRPQGSVGRCQNDETNPISARE